MVLNRWTVKVLSHNQLRSRMLPYTRSNSTIKKKKSIEKKNQNRVVKTTKCSSPNANDDEREVREKKIVKEERFYDRAASDNPHIYRLLF